MKRLFGFSTMGALAMACGGTVVFVEDGGEGAGGGGASGPGGKTTSVGTTVATTNVTVVSTSTGMGSACDQFCAATGDCFTGSNCLADCAGFYVPGCEPQTDALLICLAQNIDPGTCNLPGDACAFEIDQYEACGSMPDCISDACGFDRTSCSCTGTCFGGTLTVYCDKPSAQCSCFYEDAFIGSCTGFDCDLPSSCCYDLFLEDF